MINVAKKTVTAWYQKLHGALSVPVYVESVPEEITSSFVLLRVEGESNNSTKAYFGKNLIVIVDIVTVFQNMIDTSEVDTIDQQISQLILPSVGTHGLVVSGFQICGVTYESSSYIREDRIYRKIIRYNHLINE